MCGLHRLSWALAGLTLVAAIVFVLLLVRAL